MTYNIIDLFLIFIFLLLYILKLDIPTKTNEDKIIPFLKLLLLNFFINISNHLPLLINYLLIISY